MATVSIEECPECSALLLVRGVIPSWDCPDCDFPEPDRTLEQAYLDAFTLVDLERFTPEFLMGDDARGRDE